MGKGRKLIPHFSDIGRSIDIHRKGIANIGR